MQYQIRCSWTNRLRTEKIDDVLAGEQAPDGVQYTVCGRLFPLNKARREELINQPPGGEDQYKSTADKPMWSY